MQPGCAAHQRANPSRQPAGFGARAGTDTAAALHLSESAAKSRIHRFRQRWAALVREEVARTVDDPAEVDAELRHLLACLRG